MGVEVPLGGLAMLRCRDVPILLGSFPSLQPSHGSLEISRISNKQEHCKIYQNQSDQGSSKQFSSLLLKWGDDVHSTYRAHGFKSAFSCRGLFRVTRLWLYPGWGTEVPEFSPQFARTYTYHTVDGRNLAPVEVGSLSHDLPGFIHPRWLGMGFLPSRISGILWVDPRVPSPLLEALSVGGEFSTIIINPNKSRWGDQGMCLDGGGLTDDFTFKTLEGCCKLMCWFVSGNWEKNWIQVDPHHQELQLFQHVLTNHVFCDVVDVCC